MEDRRGDTVAYVGSTTIDGERVVAMRSSKNPQHIRFEYFQHQVFSDSDSEEEKEFSSFMEKTDASQNGKLIGENV